MDTKRLSELSVIFLAVVVLIFLLVQFKSILMPLAIAFILSLLFTPYLRLEKKDRKQKLITISFQAAVIIGMFALMFTIFAFGIKDVNPNISDSSILSKTFTVGGLNFSLSDYLTFDSTQITNVFSSVLSAISSFFSALFTVLIFLIFVLPALDGLIKGALKKPNKKANKEFLQTIYDLETSVKRYLNVKTLISFLTGLASFIILILFGVDMALLFALIIFLFNYVPSIGSIVAVLLVLIYELLFSGFSTGFVFLAILLIVIQVVLGNIVEPKLAGKRLNISALVVILSLFFWGAIWGVGGMFFSVPLTLCAMTISKHVINKL